MGVQEVKKSGMVIDAMDLAPDELVQELDRGEQGLEDEVGRMLRSWDRGSLVEEISESPNEVQDEGGYYNGEDSFDDLKEQMTELEGGQVWVKKLKENPSGKEITALSTILFDCVGYLEYNPESFDSTIQDGKPKLTNLYADDRNGVFPGVLVGLLTLRQGERAHILLHPAVGLRGGCPPNIPPNSWAYYYVKIHKVWDEGCFDGMLQYERQMLTLIPLEEKVLLATKHKDVAGQYLSDGQPREALVRYKAAVKWLHENPQEELDASPECRQLMSILWQNIAITQNKLGMHKSATKSAKTALSIDGNNMKAVFQLAKARIELGDFDRALKIIEKAENLWPSEKSFLHLKSKINVQKNDEKQKRDELLVKMAGVFNRK